MEFMVPIKPLAQKHRKIFPVYAFSSTESIDLWQIVKGLLGVQPVYKMKFCFNKSPAGFGNGHIEYKEKLLLIYNGFDSGGMIKFTVFFEANTDLLDVGRFHIPIKLSGNCPGDDLK